MLFRSKLIDRVRVAIIDLGTNSVRFDVNQIGPGARVRQLHREKLMVRLGQGVFLEGKLDRNAVHRTSQAFQSFLRTAQELGANKIIAFGTSALREAADTDRFLRLIHKRTGISIKVISGQEEAKLISEGILANEKTAKGRFALVDIGGGSCEVSVCRTKTVDHSDSFPLGTARLQQVFLKNSPPKSSSKNKTAPIEQLRRYIRSILLPKIISEEWSKSPRIIGSSGTIRAIAKIVRKTGGGGKVIELKDLSKLVISMSTMNTTQLLGIPGMESKRVDMILAGAILLEEVMLAVGAKKVTPTDFSLRDGILQEEIRLYRQRKASHISLHIPDLYAKARRFGGSEAHLKQVVAVSELLFDQLKSLHRLKPEWKTYLTAAAILHDVGQAVSPTRYELHSYYIVKNADFPSMENWESEFVAHLCLAHQGGKVDLKLLPFGKNKPLREAYFKLLALLRIANALDRGHKSQIRLEAAKIDRKRVRLITSDRTGIDLEVLRIEQKKSLFEEVFKRELSIERA